MESQVQPTEEMQNSGVTEGAPSEPQVTPEASQGQPELETPTQDPTPAQPENQAQGEAAPAQGDAPGQEQKFRTVPRTLPEIQKEYDELIKQAGEAFFQREFHDSQLEQMKPFHRSLVAEGQDRIAMDKAESERKLKAAKEQMRKKGAAALPVKSPGDE